jgi:4-hydroxybenzoate polyprenyltransferase
MQQLKIFIELTRLNKPIGFMLLFWPCSWGLAYANSINQNTNLFIYYLVLFFLGSVLMRSAGCIFNDIADKNFDKKVKRTKSRPIASESVSVKQALFYVLILCLLAFFILIQFNYLTILFGMGSMLFAFSYPFMKRITHWPQLFLGITFNWGAVMAWTAITNTISGEIFVLYISAIFWTLGYDTIYGAQDMSEDEIIGLKSTAIKFKKNIKLFVLISYSITTLTMLYFFRNYIELNIFTFLLCFFIFSLIFQIVKFNKDKPKTCLQMFKFNNYSGLFIFLSILSINL